MGVQAVTELARTYEANIGGGPATATRRWACTLDDSTLENNPPTEQEIFTAVGLTAFGQQHDSLTALGLRKFVVSERYGDSPYHVEVVAEYGVCSANEVLAPLSRTAEWSFESKPGQVPALFYYDGSGNSTLYPLTNSAYDYFEGLTTDESLVTAKMKKNFAAFPSAQMSATNSINSDSYLGGGVHTWKVAGVNTSLVYEQFNFLTYGYWATTCELVYRQTGWKLQLPDVGWNFISGGEKRRAMVFDFKNGEWVASANPVALDGDGGLAVGRPAVLPRRVNPETNFLSLFGAPPS